jgi:hypothetical protein
MDEEQTQEAVSALEIYEQIEHPNTATVRKQLEKWRGE